MKDEKIFLEHILDSINHVEVIYSKDLLVTKDQLKRFEAIPPLNGVMEREFNEGIVFSDQDIASGLNITRRTVTKYRELSGIPNRKERKQAYDARELNNPYLFFSNS